MKNLLKAAVLPLAIMAAESQAALAAPYVNSIASINNITISTTGSATFDYNFIDSFTVDMIVNNGTAFEESAYFSDVYPTSVFVQSSDTGYYDEAQATASEFNESFAVADAAGDAYAQAYSNLGFDVDGQGTVNISFDVSYVADLLSISGNEYLEFGVSVSDSFGGYDELAGQFVGWDGDVYISESDVLTLSFLVDGADQGYLELASWAFADTAVAPVPVPAAAWLFGSALLGLAGFFRKKKAA